MEMGRTGKRAGMENMQKLETGTGTENGNGQNENGKRETRTGGRSKNGQELVP